MKKNISDEAIKYIIGRIIENAGEAISESKKNEEDTFNLGRRLAYYEVLDVLKSELDIYEADLKDFGLDINLESML